MFNKLGNLSAKRASFQETFRMAKRIKFLQFQDLLQCLGNFSIQATKDIPCISEAQDDSPYCYFNLTRKKEMWPYFSVILRLAEVTFCWISQETSEARNYWPKLPDYFDLIAISYHAILQHYCHYMEQKNLSQVSSSFFWPKWCVQLNKHEAPTWKHNINSSQGEQ